MSKNKYASLPVVGPHALGAVLDECPEMLLELWVSNQSIKEHPQLLDQARSMGLAVKRVRSDTLAEIDKAHRGLLGWCRPPRLRRLDWLTKTINSGLLLALDRVTDAHNFGACLRSAEAASVAGVLLPARHAAGLSPGAAKSSSGALFRVPLIACDSLASDIRQLGELGWNTLALSEQANDSLFAYQPGDRELVVVGNEHQGIGPQTASACQHKLAIPTQGKNASLNVAVAGGVAVLTLAARM